MKKTIFLSLVILISFSVTVSGQITSTIQGNLSDLVIDENSDFYIRYVNTADFPGNFIINSFYYTDKEEGWPYGTGFEITHTNRTTPLWYIKINGDFGPHTINLVDLNSDDKSDLFFFVGGEDLFSTYAYKADYDFDLNSDFDEKNFQLVYSNKNHYAVLIRPDSSLTPIIMGSESTSSYGLSCSEIPYDYETREEYLLNIDPKIKARIFDKYFELTKGLDQYNFHYGMPNSYPLINSFILDPIKLTSVFDNESIDVTHKFPEYISWRIGILKEIKSTASEHCNNKIDMLIEHYKKFLD
jgi:hypothetical protein